MQSLPAAWSYKIRLLIITMLFFFASARIRSDIYVHKKSTVGEMVRWCKSSKRFRLYMISPS